jgi:hypothetical protein
MMNLNVLVALGVFNNRRSTWPDQSRWAIVLISQVQIAFQSFAGDHVLLF